MGMVPGDWDVFLPQIYKGFTHLEGKNVLELGNQTNQFYEPAAPRMVWRSLGFNHTMVDINGEDGAEILDLREPDQWVKWHNYFDVITNCGVTEHVEPNSVQYTAWKVIHDCLKPGGFICNAIPHKMGINMHRWANHCTVYYDEEFFDKLCEASGYVKLDHQIVREHSVCILYKQSNEFPSEEQFMEWPTFR